MKVTKTGVATVVALVVLAGGVVYLLTQGREPVLSIAAGSGPVIKFEAAGTNWSGWPEMIVSVNGKEVERILVDQQKRSMFTVHTPSDTGEISTVEVKLVKETDCAAQDFVNTVCGDRQVTIRGLFIDEKKIENPEATGPRNSPYTLKGVEGGITWNVTS